MSDLPSVDIQVHLLNQELTRYTNDRFQFSLRLDILTAQKVDVTTVTAQVAECDVAIKVIQDKLAALAAAQEKTS